MSSTIKMLTRLAIIFAVLGLFCSFICVLGFGIEIIVRHFGLGFFYVCDDSFAKAMIK